MILIKNGHIKTMVSPDMEKGCILLGDDGKIAAIGQNLTAPEGATVIDAEGRLVTPGCIEAHCHVGLREEAMGWEGNDLNEKTASITPHMRGIDSVRPGDKHFIRAIQYGITSAATGPGSSNVVGGTFAAIKLVGNRVDDMIIKDPVAMKAAFGCNPKGAHGQQRKAMPRTRMGVAAMLRELLMKTKCYMEAKESGKNPAFDMQLECMIPVLKKEIPLKCHTIRAEDSFTAIRIAREFDIDITLDHVLEGHNIADQLAQYDYPIIFGPIMNATQKIESREKNPATAGILCKAGCKVSLSTDCDVVNLHHLLLTAALCVGDGMPYEEAWKAVTVNPAEALGIADRVGSLEVGKDADVVIWTEDPLIYACGRAYTTIVDGKIVWQRA